MRGASVRSLGLPLPPTGLPAGAPDTPRLAGLRSGRPLKRWRWVAGFGADLMLCAGDARIGPVPQRWWALAERDAPLLERTGVGSVGLRIDTGAGPDASVVRDIRLEVRRRDVEIDLLIEASGGPEVVEVVSPTASGGWIWTRKQAGIRARGTVLVRGRRRSVELRAVIDDSAGYHDRRTAWRWSTGVGTAVSGEQVAWNLVDGVHDAPTGSERTLWIDGIAREVGPARFADDLSRLDTEDGGTLDFAPWATRTHRASVVVFRSDYRQPFGTFGGELPGGLRLVEGYGVMEEHDVRW